MDSASFDQSVFTTLDQAPFALTIGELSGRVHESEALVAEALERLVTAGRAKMTADIETRAYCEDGPSQIAEDSSS